MPSSQTGLAKITKFARHEGVWLRFYSGLCDGLLLGKRFLKPWVLALRRDSLN